jgi:hypothetical protein
VHVRDQKVDEAFSRLEYIYLKLAVSTQLAFGN